MKRFILFFAFSLAALGANAQFAPNTVLTAAALNNALAAPTITGGSINGTTSILTSGSVTLNGVNTFGANTNAVTQGFTDDSTLVTTSAFVRRSILSRTAFFPIPVSSGTYNFATAGTGAIFSVSTSGGAIASITGIVAGGTGYQVGDIIALVAGNGDGLLYVSSVSSGVVTGATVFYGGTGYTGTPIAGTGQLSAGGGGGGITGALTGDVTIIVPNGTFLAGARRIGFQNNTTGAFNVTVKLSNGSGGSVGSGTVLPQGTGNSTSIILFTDGVTDIWPEVATAPSFVVANTLTVGGVSVKGRYSATTGSLGGGSLAAGTCATTTVSVAGATTAMVVSVSPVADPGGQFFWKGFVSSANIVTVAVCNGGSTGTPTATTYNVRVLP